MRARQSAHIAVLRPSGEPDSKTAAISKKCPAAQRRDFFDSLPHSGWVLVPHAPRGEQAKASRIQGKPLAFYAGGFRRFLSNASPLIAFSNCLIPCEAGFHHFSTAFTGVINLQPAQEARIPPERFLLLRAVPPSFRLSCSYAPRTLPPSRARRLLRRLTVLCH